MKKNICISLLGTVLDQGKSENRWNKWRPSVGICQQKNFPISKYYLLFQNNFWTLAERVIKDIKSVSPYTEVVPAVIELNDPWDFEEVYSVLLDFTESLKFLHDREEYFVHITTGTHVAQICLFLLTE